GGAVLIEAPEVVLGAGGAIAAGGGGGGGSPSFTNVGQPGERGSIESPAKGGAAAPNEGVGGFGSFGGGPGGVGGSGQSNGGGGGGGAGRVRINTSRLTLRGVVNAALSVSPGGS
ncbi:MAG: hypothetical protein KC503_05950, partial [Myxococcales bacterium]|nr:hypothetical protein [Myxococcales bacterium]